MKLIVNEFIREDKWKKLEKTSPYVSPFQSYGILDIYSRVPNIETLVCAIEDKDEYLALAVIAIHKEKGIRAYFSKRAVIYGGPLLLQGFDLPVLMLLNGLEQHLKSRAIYCEIRNYFDYSSYHEIFKSTHWKLVPYLNLHLNVANKDITEVMSGMRYNRRREINLSLNSGVVFSETKRLKDIYAVYLIVKQLYSKKLHLPIPDFEYFKAISESKLGVTFAIIHENNIVGGIFCLKLHRVIYTLYYAGLSEYNKRVYPNHIAILAVINYALDNNFEYIDFMGAGRPGIEYGVRNYKIQFGGKLVEHGRAIKIFKPWLFEIGKLAVKFKVSG
jgi:serine/alanine adding enzyme